MNKIILKDEQLKILEDQIKKKFLDRSLYKGVAEVINAIIERKSITKVYLVGQLDPWYESSITKSLIQTELEIDLVRIDKKYQRLVYDVIKDLELPKAKERIKSRRFFLTRAFAL